MPNVNRRVGVVLLCALVLLAIDLRAQRTTGDLLGVVRDASGAILPGVTVSVSGPNIARTQTTITSETGSYRIANLPPGTYGLSSSCRGSGPSCSKAFASISAAPSSRTSGWRSASSTESVSVVAESPVVDTTSNEVGTTFDKDWVTNAPTRRFGFYDLLAQAPGSVKGGDGTAAGERRTMSFGGSFDENAFQLDGVNVTDNFFSEGFSEPNPDTIEEVEILALGAPAEYGNVMGAVYNIVTKQGTNQFHGDASGFFQSQGLTSNNTKNVKFPNDTFADACADDPDARCPWTRGDYYEATAQLGGPILRDRLLFFGSYGHQKDEFTRVGVNSELPGSSIDTTKDRVLAKVTWQMTPGQRLVGNFHFDRSPSDTGYSFNETPSTAWTRTQKAPTPGVAYTATLSDKTLLDVRYSGFYGNVTGYPSDPSQPLDSPASSTERPARSAAGTTTGTNTTPIAPPRRRRCRGMPPSSSAPSRTSTSAFSTTRPASRASTDTTTSSTPIWSTASPTGTATCASRSATPRRSGTSARSSTATIRIGDRVTLNLGVRGDYSKALAPEQEELDDNAQPTGRTFPRTDFFTWDSISPRLGVNMKLNATGRPSSSHIGAATIRRSRPASSPTSSAPTSSRTTRAPTTSPPARSRICS